MKTRIIPIAVFIFGLAGGIALAIALSGTNVVFPGLGLVVSGALLGFIAGVFLGAIFGLIVGYLASRRIV